MTNKQIHYVEIVRICNVAPEKIIDAFTNAEILKKWAVPAGWEAMEASADARVGGSWRHCIRNQENRDIKFCAGGIFNIIDPNRLEYTMVDENEEGKTSDEQLIVVALKKVEGGTQMTFRHEQLQCSENPEIIEQSWNEMFDKLEQSVA